MIFSGLRATPTGVDEVKSSGGSRMKMTLPRLPAGSKMRLVFINPQLVLDSHGNGLTPQGSKELAIVVFGVRRGA